MDIASGDALELLVRDVTKFTDPENLKNEYLGTGLSGDIHGGRGRAHMFKIGPYELYDIPALYPPAEIRSKQEGADGIIGCQLLRRFNVVYNYFESKMYIKPNRTYEAPFE
jgi:hypothetical protein